MLKNIAKLAGTFVDRIVTTSNVITPNATNMFYYIWRCITLEVVTSRSLRRELDEESCQLLGL